MVELFEQNLRTNDRQSSKGNQLKWENEGIWYKADFTGYEGLTEYVISHLLQYTNLRADEFVLYDPIEIHYKKQIYKGAKSKDFLNSVNEYHKIIQGRGLVLCPFFVYDDFRILCETEEPMKKKKLKADLILIGSLCLGGVILGLILWFTGMLTGAVIGLIGGEITRRMEKILRIEEKKEQET